MWFSREPDVGDPPGGADCPIPRPQHDLNARSGRWDQTGSFYPEGERGIFARSTPLIYWLQSAKRAFPETFKPLVEHGRHPNWGDRPVQWISIAPAAPNDPAARIEPPLGLRGARRITLLRGSNGGTVAMGREFLNCERRPSRPTRTRPGSPAGTGSSATTSTPARGGYWGQNGTLDLFGQPGRPRPHGERSTPPPARGASTTARGTTGAPATDSSERQRTPKGLSTTTACAPPVRSVTRRRRLPEEAWTGCS